MVSVVSLGNSDLHVSPLALGGNTFGWTSDEATSHAVLDAFVAGGGNFVDTADVYSAWAEGNPGGVSEKIIGRWFAARGNRDSVVLATKVAQHPDFRGLKAANIRAAAEASLQRLGTDYIDLYYAHEEDPNTPKQESVVAFAELQKEGKIRHVGLSNFSPEGIREWMMAADAAGAERPIVLQPHYNLLFRKEYERTYLPVVRQFGLATVPYFSLASGLLTGKYSSEEDIAGARADMVKAYLADGVWDAIATVKDVAEAHHVAPASVALAWLRDQAMVAAPIASARTVEQVAPLVEAMTLQLTSEEIHSLSAASANLK